MGTDREAQLAGEVKGLAQGPELFRITATYPVIQQVGTENQKMMGSYTQVLAALSALGGLLDPLDSICESVQWVCAPNMS